MNTVMTGPAAPQGDLRLCVLGNSHLAAFRAGWDLVAERYPMLRPTFFGSTRDQAARVRRSGNVVRPLNEDLANTFAWTSGGLREIVLDDYDAFVFVGLGLGFTGAARLYGEHRALGQSMEYRVKALVSRAAFDATMQSRVRNSLSLVLARLFRGATDRPIIIIPDPLPGEAATGGKEGSLWQHLATHPDGEALYASFRTIAESEAAATGAVFLAQTAATRAGPIYTKDALRMGAVRMRPTGNVPMGEDYGHMGPDYGVALIEATAAILGGHPAEEAMMAGT